MSCPAHSCRPQDRAPLASLFALLLLMSLALAATTPTTTTATASLHSSLASRTSPAPPTPTIPIPPQCQPCHGPNSTFPAMVCYKNTQCVPQTYLCDTISNPCTDSDGEPDSDDPILCNNDQLCVPQNYLPYPSPGFGKVQQTDSCLSGSYYSLYGSTKKYTKSCIEPFVDRPPDCEPWEYAAQSSCYLSTCGEPDLNCEPPFVCQKAHPNDPYGLCSNPNDPSGNSGGAAGTSDGGSTTDRYSSRDYLIQGLLIGACSLAIGVGLGVGFWHYRQKKRSRTQWAPSSNSSSSSPSPATASSLAPGAAAAADAAGDSSTSKHPSWLSTVLLCGRNKSRQRSATVSMDSNHNVPSSGQHRDSLVDSESLEGSLFGDQRRRERSNNMLFSGRWRWGERTTSAHQHALSRNLVMMMSMGPPDPEMDPPPVYHIGPKLPAYTDRTEDLAWTSVHATTAPSAQTTDPPESTRPSSHPSSTRSAYDRHSSGSLTDLTTRAHLQPQGNPPDIVRAQEPRHHIGTSTSISTDTDTDMDMDTSASSSNPRHSSNTHGSNIPMPERAHLRKQD